MSGAIPWDVLQTQYFQDSVYEKEIKKLIQCPGQVSVFVLRDMTFNWMIKKTYANKV